MSHRNTARAVRRAMHRCGVDQTELGRRIKTTPADLDQMLRGRRPMSTDTLASIAQALTGADVPTQIHRLIWDHLHHAVPHPTQ